MEFHIYYKQLTEQEKTFVDNAFRNMFAERNFYGVKLDASDKAEIAVDAIAKWIVESR